MTDETRDSAASLGSPEWIPVKGRLPKWGQRVIVAYERHHAQHSDPLHVDCETFWNDLRGGWSGCDSMAGGRPIYWMPLPEPPTD